MTHSSQKTRWGILSTGHIAGKFAEALQILPEAELYAVASRTREKADAFARKYGFRRAYGTYEELSADPAVDAVYIATPHVFHLDNALMCLRAGKAVLCEKALTINARETEEMIRVAREENIFLMEAMIPPHVPLVKKILKRVREGRIGEVRLFSASRGLRRDFGPESRQLKRELGGGSLLDLGVYPVSFAAMIFEEPPAEAAGVAHIGKYGTDEQGAAVLKYSHGAIADVSFALRTATANDARIYGTEGSVHIDAVFAVPERAVFYDHDGRITEVLEEPLTGNGLNYEAAEVMRCLREGLKESPFMPPERSLEVMQTLDRIREPWGLRYPNDEG